MKQRPILFSAPMVRALLAVHKTQTRRIVKEKMLQRFDLAAMLGECSPLDAHHPNDQSYFKLFCPYGEVGDQLWVREAFGEVYDTCEHPEANSCPDERWHIEWKYRADSENPVIEHGCFTGWKPSIHMPREASRILLEITDVRIERLNDISKADAMAEGINCYQFYPDDGFPLCDGYTHLKDDGKCILYPTALEAFKELWQSINGADSWAANPWVWVVSFRVVQGGDL